MPQKPRVLGVGLVLISSALFGWAPTLVTFSFKHGSNIVGTMFTRFASASLLMLLGRPLFARGIKWPNRKVFTQVFLLGAIGFFVGTFMYFTALKHIDSGLAVVIWYWNPVAIVLLSWLVNHHKPSRSTIACLVLTLIGVAITVGQVGGGNNFSIFLVVGSALEYSIYMILSVRVMPKTDLYTGVNIVMLGAATAYGLYWLLAPASIAVEFPTDTLGWLIILFLGIVSTACATAALFAGLKIIGAASTSVLMTFEPIEAIILGHLFFSEPVTTMRIIGATFVIGAVGALAVVESRSKAVPDTNLPIYL